MSIDKHIYDPLIRQQIQLTLDAIYACNIIKKLSESDRHLATYRLLFSRLNNRDTRDTSDTRDTRDTSDTRDTRDTRDTSDNYSLITVKIQELTRALTNIDEVLDDCDEILNI